MVRGKRKSSIWGMLVALLAAAIFLYAPASQAMVHTCPTESASVSHHVEDAGDHSHPTKPGYDGKACCMSACVLCISLVPSPGEATVRLASVTDRFMTLSSHLSGHDPAPGLEPPRSAV